MREEIGAKSGVTLAKADGDQSLNRLTKEFLALVAEEPFDLAIDENDRAPAIDHHHAVRGRLHRGAEAGFRPFSGGDVDDRRQYENPFRRLDRIQPDLDRDLHAVLANAVKVAARAHGPGLRMREEVTAEAGVTRADLLRHEHFDGLPEQLLSCVSEQPLDLAIEE